MFRFQPTPSARRVTTAVAKSLTGSPISTHTLRKEGDGVAILVDPDFSGFQPTPSARRVTAECWNRGADIFISTHTLRKEGDRLPGDLLARGGDFNPHPPQGG